MTRTAQDMAQEIAARIGAREGRQLIAVAGPPGSGKSTVAEALRELLTLAGRPAGLVAMDGFHMDNAILDRRGLRARKGAPDTFDLDGLTALLNRVHNGAAVLAPRFDRALDVSVGSAVEITLEMQVVIVEGNYLLLDAPGWRDLRQLWSLSVMLTPGLEVLEQRLMQRWLDHGFTPAAARQKVEENDLPNARLVLEQQTPADLLLS